MWGPEEVRSGGKVVPQNLRQTKAASEHFGYITPIRCDTFFLTLKTPEATVKLLVTRVSPPQHSPSSSINAVVHLHVIKLTHILSLQAEVPEAQFDDVTLLNGHIPYAQLMGNVT